MVGQFVSWSTNTTHYGRVYIDRGDAAVLVEPCVGHGKARTAIDRAQLTVTHPLEVIVLDLQAQKL